MAESSIDINELFKQYALQSSAQQAVVSDTDRTAADLVASTQAEVDAITREGELTGRIQTGVDDILIQRAQRNKEAAAFFGVNPEAHNSIIQEMSRDLLARNKELKESGASIAEKQSMSFMDNPLEWIMTQLALPFEIQAHQSKQAVFEQQLDGLGKLGDLADKQIARNNAIDANTNAALSSLVAERALVVAKKQAEDAKQKAMQMGVQFGSVRLAASQGQFQNTVAVHNASIAVQQLQLTRATHAQNEAGRKLQQKQLELLIAAKEEDLAAQAELQANLDRATGILGMRKITAREYKAAPQRLQAALWDVMSNPSVAEGRLGYDAVDALETANNLNAPLTPALTEVKNMVNNWTATASAKPEFAALKPGEKHTKMQEAVMLRVRDEASNIPDSGGLYSAPSLQSVGKIPAVANTILWKSTFAPLAATSRTTPTSAQAIYDAAFTLVQDKKMDIDRASAEIAIIYKAITVDNSQQRDYNRFALPMQSNYRTTINSGSLLGVGGRKVIDMTNPQEIKNTMLRNLAVNKQERFGGFTYDSRASGQRPATDSSQVPE